MILEGRDLAIGYAGKVIGRDVGLAIAAGQILALLGPNGCGKTTLLKTLIGLLPPLAGDVLCEGRPLADLSATERARRIAYVPQVHTGAFAFSVADVVLMGRTAHGGFFSRPSRADERAAASALARLGIAALGPRPYTMISGGERQLVLIARALAQEPRVIVLDEPTASLDFGNQGRVLRELRTLADLGLAVLFTTHDPNAALQRADRVAMIRDGRVLAEGGASTVVTRERIEALYGAPVTQITSGERSAYLPA